MPASILSREVRPQPPSYYHLPLIFAFTLLFLFLGAALMSWGRERDYSKGLAQGTIVGFMMFFIFMMVVSMGLGQPLEVSP